MNGVFETGDTVPALIVKAACEVEAGDRYWGCAQRNHWRKGWLLEPEPIIVEQTPRRRQGKVMVESMPFDPHDLVLVELR